MSVRFALTLKPLPGVNGMSMGVLYQTSYRVASGVESRMKLRSQCVAYQVALEACGVTMLALTRTRQPTQTANGSVDSFQFPTLYPEDR